MNRRAMCRYLAATPMVLAMAAVGQSPSVLRVAWVSPEGPDSNSPNLVAFRTGMQELGYVEGRNLVIHVGGRVPASGSISWRATSWAPGPM